MNFTPEQMVVLAAVGGFLTSQVWPWFRGLVDLEFKSRQDERRAAVANHEDRFLKAFEQSAQAQETMARASIDTAAALQVMAQMRVADNLVLQRMERRIEDRHWGDKHDDHARYHEGTRE